MRPSAKTSILAPARCGVDPLERTIVTSAAGSPRSRAAAAAGRTCSFMASDEDLDLGLLLQPFDERRLVRALLLLLEEFLDARLGLLERHGAFGTVIRDLDDVIAELGLDDVA